MANQKEILKALTLLTDANYNITAVNWVSGEVTFRVGWDKLTDERTDGMQPLLDYLRTGRKLDAIREYRRLYGVGLADAKRAVEEMIISKGLGYKDRAGNIQLGNLVPVEPWAPEDADDRVPEDRIDF